MYVVNINDRISRKRHRPLNGVLKLANIAGPVIIHEQLQCSRCDLFNFLLIITDEARQEVVRQVGNVFFVITQRRDVNGNNIEPIIQILPEGPLLKSSTQVFVGCSNQADIYFKGFRSPQALKFTLLEHAQQLDLRGSGNVADFVEKYSSFIGQFKFSRLAGDGPSESPSFKAK